MDFIKKQKIGFLAYLLVAILTGVSLVVYIMDVNMPYYEDMDASVASLISIALLLSVAVLVLPQFMNGKVANIIVDVCRIALSVLIIWACVSFLAMRVESFGYIFGSNLELGNDAAYEAANMAVVGLILLAVTWVFSVIASFLPVGKK